LPADAPTFFFLDIQPDQRDAFKAIVNETPGITHPIVMPNLRGRIVSVNDVPAEKALIDSRESWLLSNDRGFTFTSDLPAHSEILEGAWWPANYSGQPIVSVVKDVQNAFAVKPGNTMTFSILGREITAKVANVRDVNWANFTINFAITFAPGALDAAPYSSLATVVATGDAENILQRKIVRVFPNVTMINVKDAIDTFSQLMNKMNIAVQVMAFITLITGLIVLVESLLAARQERKYETVVLKVIGFSPGRLRNIMLYEYVLLGGVAVGFSALFGTLISRLIIHDWMGFEWNFYPGLVAQTIMFSMMIIVGVSWLVQRGILKSSVMEQLRND
jgi:putative ABC transport system permease protein